MLRSNCNIILIDLSFGKHNFAAELLHDSRTAEGDAAALRGSVGGSILLANLLKVNTTLESLDLGYFEHETLSSFAATLMINCTIKQLTIVFEEAVISRCIAFQYHLRKTLVW